MLVRALRAAAVVLVVGAGSTVPVGVARAADGCATPTGVYTGTTAWAQALLQPAQVWPIASGAGQTVAVVSSGIDRANAQFGPGQIRAGVDVLPTGRTDPFTDCDGRGTFAAGIVAARPNDGTTFAGLAPDASLLAVRDIQASGDSTAGAGPLPDLLAAAIAASVDAGATVVLVGVPSPQDSPALRAAVAAAHAAGVVVVSPAVQTQAGATSYPTAYPGVIGVGAEDRSGAPLQAESGDYIALAAPGSQLVSTAAGAAAGSLGHAYPVEDPAFAAAYVAGAVAVLRSARPELTPDQVAAQLTFTADHPPNGRDPRLGWGTVDLLAAVTADLPAAVASPGSAAAVPAAPSRVAALAAPAPTPAPDRLGGVLALAGVVLAAAVCLVAVTIRRGRRRGWRPGRAVHAPGPTA